MRSRQWPPPNPQGYMRGPQQGYPPRPLPQMGPPPSLRPPSSAQPPAPGRILEPKFPRSTREGEERSPRRSQNPGRADEQFSDAIPDRSPSVRQRSGSIASSLAGRLATQRSSPLPRKLSQQPRPISASQRASPLRGPKSASQAQSSPDDHIRQQQQQAPSRQLDYDLDFANLQAVGGSPERVESSGRTFSPRQSQQAGLEPTPGVRFAGLRSDRGYGRGNFRGQRGATGRGRSGAGRGGPRRQQAAKGPGLQALGRSQESTNFKSPTPTTVLDANGLYCRGLAVPDLLPAAIRSSGARLSIGDGTDYSSSAVRIIDHAGTSKVNVPGHPKSVPLILPKGVEAPHVTTDGTSTALTPFRWSDLTPAKGEVSREGVVGSAIEALAHHAPSMDIQQKAKIAALIGYIASNREQRADLVRK